MDNLCFGIVLRKLRNEQQLSQEGLAGLSSRHPSCISLLERDLKSPTLDTFVAIAHGLDMRASEMLKELEQHPENSWLIRPQKRGSKTY